MSQVDQKRAFNKMKHQLEPYRGLIMQANSLLTWEKSYAPGVLVGAISVFYLTLYALDFSVLTMLSLTMWFGVLCDYLFPTITRLLPSADKWVGEQEAQFEEVCGSICSIRCSLGYWLDALYKEPKSPVFVAAVSFVLLGIAYVGCIVNNLLLMYLLTLGLTLWPGVQKKQLLSAVTTKASTIILSKFKSIKQE